jgi:hypothetical protein
VRLIVHNYLPASRTSDTGAGRQFVHAWQQARKFDALKYLDGLAKLTFTDDVDQWNAGYSAALDEISVERKFMKKSLFDMIQTLLHEAGHRGQKFDPQTFKAYEAAGLAKLKFFLAMANDVHQKDYREHGIKSDVMRDEVFAESYSRFALGMKMPDALYKFWTERARAS